MDNEFKNNEAVEKMLIEILRCPDINWSEERVNDRESVLSICTPDGANLISVEKRVAPENKMPRVKLIFKNVVSTDSYYEEHMEFESKTELRSSKKRDLYNACVSLFETFYSNKEAHILDILRQFFPHIHDNN